MVEVKTAFITHFDVFMWGILVGGLLVIICQFLEKALNLWLKKNDMKLNLTLGKALEEMQEKIKNGKT